MTVHRSLRSIICNLPFSRTSSAAFGVLAMLLLAGCGDEPIAPERDPVVGIELDADTTRMSVGDTIVLHATAIDSAGAPVVGEEFTWMSTDTSVAKVDPTGRVSGQSAGTVTITAGLRGLSASVELEVEEALATVGILFQASRAGGNWDIYLVRSDGTQLINLTDHPAEDVEPAWSPDHSRIVFVSNRDGNRELYSMAADGSDVRRLTETAENEAWPAWSPDGTRIAFEAPWQFGTAIWFMDADGENRTEILPGGYEEYAPSYRQPAWSPDGRQMLYTRTLQASGGGGVGVVDLQTGARSFLQKNFLGGTRTQHFDSAVWFGDGA